MDQYPYESLWINGRELSLRDVIANTANAFTEFEYNTFLFLREWISGTSSFTLHTSGSTGPPKEIHLRREQMMASAALTGKVLQLIPGMTALVCLDTRYIAGKMMLVRCLHTGMKIVAVDPCANPFQKLPSSLHLDFVALVPYQVTEILESAEATRLNSVRTIIIGGAVLQPSAERKLRLFRCQSYITYGMTETISHIALHKIGDGHNMDFTALPGVKISQDERGCLVIEANHLPEKVITNDVVRLVGAQTFSWLGRWDNVINTGGVKIHSEKIEAQIEKVFTRLNIDIRYLIAGLADPKLGERVVLILEGDHDPELGEMIKNELKSTLLRFEYPKDVFFIPAFPSTDTGKIDRPATLRIIKTSEIF